MVRSFYTCRSRTLYQFNTHLGGTFIAKAPNAASGVEITIVFASHANNVPLSLLSEAQRTALALDDAGLVLGPPTGYVVKFTNGLTAYLSGDTGIHTEMKTVVNEFHKANLALLNLGPSAGTVLSGAYAMNELVRPAAVILTHPNEAVTEGGKLRPTQARISPSDQRSHDGIRRQREVHRWLLIRYRSSRPGPRPRRYSTSFKSRINLLFTRLSSSSTRRSSAGGR